MWEKKLTGSQTVKGSDQLTWLAQNKASLATRWIRTSLIHFKTKTFTGYLSVSIIRCNSKKILNRCHAIRILINLNLQYLELRCGWKLDSRQALYLRTFVEVMESWCDSYCRLQVTQHLWRLLPQQNSLQRWNTVDTKAQSTYNFRIPANL